MSKIATIPAPTLKWPAMSKEEQEEERQQLLIRESLAVDEHGKVPSAAALVDARKVLIAHNPPMGSGQEAGMDEQTSKAAARRGRARRELG